MPLKLEAIEEPALNLTPMLDVVLLLVIFFMVGTQFSEEESHFDIDLPSGRTVEAVTGGPDPIVIDVDREGTVHVGRRTLSLVDLERELNAARERFARRPAGALSARHHRARYLPQRGYHQRPVSSPR
jgi:biopolymer transport protein ExbD